MSVIEPSRMDKQSGCVSWDDVIVIDIDIHRNTAAVHAGGYCHVVPAAASYE